MSYVQSETLKLNHLQTEVELGRIKIPQFQRDFVWDLNKSAELIDSVIKGFPIGSLIFWKTSDRLREIRNLGNLDFPTAKEGEVVNYVLDGQQRLTSLLASLLGLEITLRDGKRRKFSSLLVHLNPSDEDAPIVCTELPDDDEPLVIPLTQLWKRQGEQFDQCKGEYRTIRDDFSDRLRTYDMPKVTLNDAYLSEATEVFSRVNTGGQELSVFEIMVAKTYDPDRNFDLVEKYDEVFAELSEVRFETIDPSTILQLVTLILRDDCKKSTILDLKQDEFIQTWERAIVSLRLAIDYIRDSFRLPVSRLLPYVALVIPVSIFFDANNGNPPNKLQADLLSNFFWRAGWSERYSASSATRLGQDKKTILEIVKGHSPRLDWATKFDPDRLIDTTFSVSSAFSKTILGLLATLQPQKYNNGDLVNLQNDYMHRANSMNFHHIFPKAYLKNNDYEEWEANRLVNVSLVDDFLNKRVIRARAPSDYMDEFWTDDFEQIMHTHLIDSQWDEDDSEASAPIWSDDYDGFVEDRCNAILNLLEKKTQEH